MAEMGRRSSEKTNFAVACSLLSQYIKEKGSATDLGLGMAMSRPGELAKVMSEAIWPPTTMSLLPGADIPGKGTAAECRDASLHGNVMELFPQQSGFGPAQAAAAGKTPETRKQEKGQLTIFYGGKVMVFDDFPPDKAKDLLQLASMGTSNRRTSGYVPPPSSTAEATVVGHANGLPNLDSKLVPSPIDAPVVAAQSHLQKPSISALPQPPKASLKRFLQERKHRINATAPYQVTHPLATDGHVKSEESKSWLGLAPQVSTPSYSINSDCSR